MYCGCSKEPSHREGSFDYLQHMFWMGNKENSFPIGTLIWGSASHICANKQNLMNWPICFFLLKNEKTG